MPEERTHTASSVEWNPHAITWIAYMVRSFIYNFHLYASNYTKHHFFVLFRCFVSSLIPHIYTSFCAHFQRSTPTPCSIDKLLIISMCFVWLFYYYYFFFCFFDCPNRFHIVHYKISAKWFSKNARIQSGQTKWKDEKEKWFCCCCMH